MGQLSFAGDARLQCPLTHDGSAVRLFLDDPATLDLQDRITRDLLIHETGVWGSEIEDRFMVAAVVILIFYSVVLFADFFAYSPPLQSDAQLSLLPQGQVERKTRVLKMVEQMEKEGFGACTNTGACSVECPKGIEQFHITRLNKEYIAASLSSTTVTD